MLDTENYLCWLMQEMSGMRDMIVKLVRTKTIINRIVQTKKLDMKTLTVITIIARQDKILLKA